MRRLGAVVLVRPAFTALQAVAMFAVALKLALGHSHGDLTHARPQRVHLVEPLVRRPLAAEAVQRPGDAVSDHVLECWPHA